MATRFGFSQNNARKWVRILRPILSISLKRLALLPETESARVAILKRRSMVIRYYRATYREITGSG